MWIGRINKVLKRSGYVLKRTGEGQRLPAATHQPAPSPTNNIPVAATPIPPHTQSELPAVVDEAPGVDASEGEERLRGARVADPRRGLPSHYDDAAVETILRVRPRTMTGHWKVFGLILATRYIETHHIPGAILECGVWRGGSMQAAALTLLEYGEPGRDLHLFDTFEGMPPPTAHDSRRGVSAEELLDRQTRDHNVWAVASLDDVRKGMEETGYPTELIHYHPGRVEETIPGKAPEEIAILRLDTDWYESTKHELMHLYARLSPGGVLILDDYGHWDGARKATDEFLEETGAKLLLLPIAGGRIAVKPAPDDFYSAVGSVPAGLPEP